MKILLIDPEKCTGCGFCERICSIQHGKMVSRVKSMIGIVKIRKIEVNIPVVCQQCLNPLCMDACPTGALYKDEETGAIMVNSDLCVGCKSCIMACPLGSIFIDLEVSHAVKCDLCKGDPLCVKVCGYEAIQYLTLNDVVSRKRESAIRKLEEVMERIVLSSPIG
jgi:Fe-S-cluster-containing hydrogenase component 2